MLELVKGDLRTINRSGKWFYMVIGWVISIGVMAINISMMGVVPEHFNFAQAAFAGFHGGAFYVTLCMFTVSLIMVDYEYGNIKNICSITHKRSAFITSKMISSYIIGFIGTAVAAVAYGIFAMIVYGNRVSFGSPLELLGIIVTFSLAVNMPITLMCLFCQLIKRASYCTYVLLAMYIIPSSLYPNIEKYMHIPMNKISVLNFAFAANAQYGWNMMIHYGILAICYTTILYIITKAVANRHTAI